jgi:hypothetical protein
MLTLLNLLGMLGLAVGILGFLALWSQRDANRELRKARGRGTDADPR